MMTRKHAPFAVLIMLLALLAANSGCHKPHSNLRVDGTVDLGRGIKMEFILVQPGSFKTDFDWVNEQEREITLTKPFYLGKYEVTQKQWMQVMKKNPSDFEGPDLPVENVSWEDMQIFMKKLREMTGEKFTLPTEAQWEYACRAGATTLYFWGSNPDDAVNYTWCAANSEQTTHPVGEKLPNAWGFHDMNGNVWERCALFDMAHPDGDGTDAVLTTNSFRITRGGGFRNKAEGMRCNHRQSEKQGYRGFGLRCAVLADSTTP